MAGDRTAIRVRPPSTAALPFAATDRLHFGLEYTAFRNRIQMPGGLSDEQFAADPHSSFRARNWLASPWNLAALRVSYDFSPSARLETVLSYMNSERDLVWRNEDGGPQELDTIDPATGTFVPREVEIGNVSKRERNRGESPARRPQPVWKAKHAGNGRQALLEGTLGRFEGGPGSTGTDFDMNLYGGTWERALTFGTTNVAAFAEDILHVTDRFSITPGIRYEYLRSTSRGYTDVDSVSSTKSYSYPLLGVGTQYAASASTQIYGNVSGAYRPILYASLVPFGSIVRVDPDLRSSRGYNADLGWRGILSDVIKFDLSGFYLSYHDRVGTRTSTDATGTFFESANIGNSVHKGAEAYIELDPLARMGDSQQNGVRHLHLAGLHRCALRFGEFKGNRVEQAPRVLARVGVTYGLGPVSSTLQVSHTSSSFGDANNSVLPTDDAVAGLLPAYTLLDWSGAAKLGGRMELTFGVNNLANTSYFTKRTGEYPGPGILPGTGRRMYVGVDRAF